MPKFCKHIARRLKDFWCRPSRTFAKKKGLSSRISQDHVNEMVRVAVEEVKVLLLLLSLLLLLLLLLLYYFIIIELQQNSEFWGASALIFSNIRAKFKIKNMCGGVPPLASDCYSSV